MSSEVRYCVNCGIRLPADVNVCPRCGRLLGTLGKNGEQPRERVRQTERPGQGERRPARAQGEAPRRRERLREAVPEPDEQTEELAKPRSHRLIKRLVIIAVILTAVYFAVFGLQVLRVRHSSYEFDTPMKLTHSTFGEAFDSSVEDGSWSYDPFTFTVKYKGIHRGKEMTVEFSAGFELKVKRIITGEEEKTAKEQIDISLMGLFI
ncbi:MAG: hypothetical protein IKP47_00790 [Ruminococcus sp.]|nr:hypothetical protein [Ruminococcus sp.]